MAKRNFTPSEKRSFRKGMQAQFSKEHPLLKYEAVEHKTVYNSDGSVSFSSLRGVGFSTKKAAAAYAASSEAKEKFFNERVLKAVKSKRVNEYDSALCTTHTYSVRKLEKPYRR